MIARCRPNLYCVADCSSLVELVGVTFRDSLSATNFIVGVAAPPMVVALGTVKEISVPVEVLSPL